MKAGKIILWVLGILSVVTIVALLAARIWLRDKANFAGMVGAGGVAEVTVPPGFAVNVFAEGLSSPRFLQMGPDGAMYVADRGNGRIVRLPDDDQDGVADSIELFAENLDDPHSLVYHEGAWYVGVPFGVVKLVDEDGDGRSDSQIVLIGHYPTLGSHSTRTVAFLPDGRMVVSIGSSCNVCVETDELRAAVVVYDSAEATGERIFAPGLRNAVGLAIHPETGELWTTNNGRDLLGDDLPPETVYIVRDGADYGWPYCHSGRIEDPDEGFPGSCEGAEAPVVEMQAHSAPLGLVFYTGDMFPEEYHGDLFIAFHGSWNRTVPTGYKVVRLPLDGSTPAGPVEDFATGWLNEETQEATGRPVGVAVGADGALYVSDDKGDIIYRISYGGQ
jgi:glucose/arabinose dehydrogenase